MTPAEELVAIELSVEIEAAWLAMGEPDTESDEWTTFQERFTAIRRPQIMKDLEEEGYE